MLGNLINSSLIILSTLGLVLSLSYFVREKNAGAIRWFILAMGASVCIWCLGYGLMGFAKDDYTALIFRNVGLMGMAFFLITEGCLVINMAEVSAVFAMILRLTLIIVSAMDMAFFTRPGVNQFDFSGDRTTYIAVDCFERNFHYGYLFIVFVILLLTDILWFTRKKPKRENVFQIHTTLANFAIIVLALPDTLLPILTGKSFPTSGVGGFICLMVLLNGAMRNSAFTITIPNMGNYIYESVNTAILLFEKEGKINRVNDSAKLMLGSSVKKGASLFDIFEFDDDIISLEDFIYQCEASGKHIRAFTKNSNISCEISANIIRDKYNEIYCILCMVHDMTSTEELIREANQASEAKSAFLANMSHEIRTPINAILGMNEMVMRESNEQNVVNYSDGIESAGQALLSIVNDILDFSKIEAGKVELVSEAYALERLIKDSYNLVSVRALDKDIDFQVHVDENLPKVYRGDLIRTRQIIVNLLTNAIKYTPKGSVRFSVTGEINGKKCLLKFTVSDTGTGIKEEDLPKLFETFKRIDEARNRRIEGTGLGLPISKNLAEMMHGDIKVESTYGKGSTFVFELPQEIIDESPVGKINVKLAGAGLVVASDKGIYRAPFTAPTAKILAVDDVETNLVVLRGLLKKTNVAIETASSGAMALEMVAKTKYDIIFMDHMMPEMDGIETFHKIRDNRFGINFNTPIIMMTANAVYGAREEYMKEGFDYYISKPLRGEILEVTVQQFLEGTGKLIMLDTTEKNIESVKGIERFGSVIDVKTAKLYNADDYELFIDVVESYVTNDLTEEIEKNFRELDYENYRIKVHSLKSSSLSIGASEVSKLATDIDASIKNGEYQFVLENHQAFVEKYGKLISDLKELLANGD